MYIVTRVVFVLVTSEGDNYSNLQWGGNKHPCLGWVVKIQWGGLLKSLKGKVEINEGSM